VTIQILLEAWLHGLDSTLRVQAHHFDSVDAQLGLPAGSAHRILPKIVPRVAKLEFVPGGAVVGGGGAPDEPTDQLFVAICETVDVDPDVS